jgi:hypothetical protein
MADKQSLPYPYDQDLSEIVFRFKPTRLTTLAALPNSMKVASYLRAGATLIERNLGAQDAQTKSADGDRRPYWSGIRFLTERALIREVEKIDPPFLRQKGSGPYRSTWASHDDYINDLLAFFFHPISYDAKYDESMQTRGDWLVNEGTFVEAADRVAYYEVQAICRMPLFRLQLIMAATAHRNDGIHEAIAKNYAGVLEPWKEIHESTIAARGFRLRSGITADQLTDIMAALVEGFAVRHLGDPSAGIDGHGPAGSLVGTAAIAILNSVLEPADEPSGRSCREEFEATEERLRRKKQGDPGLEG